VLDIETLLAAIPDSPPCGPNLEYDPLFKELERIAEGTREQQLGEVVRPAEEPDWDEVRARAMALMARTKDLRVAMLLTRALVRTEHLVGLSAGLGVIHGLLERYWDSVYPPLDADEDNDPADRVNVLAALAGNELLQDVRNALLVPTGALGRVAVRDILIVLGKLEPGSGEVPRGAAQIAAAIAAAAQTDCSGVEAARASVERVNALYRLLVDKVGMENAVDLRALGNMLKAAVQVCDDTLAGQPAATDAGALAAGGPAEARAAGAANLSGEIRDRDDAVRQLERICLFFERTEPGNPAPLLIRRAQRLMNKSFVEIIMDLAPESAQQIRNLAGLKNE
jgi:type VI secretion system protein ImpA